jgi:hypothetical protein
VVMLVPLANNVWLDSFTPPRRPLAPLAPRACIKRPMHLAAPSVSTAKRGLLLTLKKRFVRRVILVDINQKTFKHPLVVLFGPRV